MAIWQYKIYILPSEEVESFFGSDSKLRIDDLDEISWWKYRQLMKEEFDVFKKMLPKNKSWSENIILYGSEDSNCIEVLIENNKIVELSARVDLRENYKDFVKLLVAFGQKNNLVFINTNLDIVEPSIDLLINDIKNFPDFKKFLNIIKKK